MYILLIMINQNAAKLFLWVKCRFAGRLALPAAKKLGIIATTGNYEPSSRSLMA
jgi:hypothetical protein